MQALEKHLNKVKPGPGKLTKILISKTVRILGQPRGQIELCMQCLLISVSGMEEAEKGKYK